MLPDEIEQFATIVAEKHGRKQGFAEVDLRPGDDFLVARYSEERGCMEMEVKRLRFKSVCREGQR